MASNRSIHKKRMPPDERRTQLLELASRILAEEGADQLRIPRLAEEAGVTRPVVYRFFPNRQAVVLALLEEFADALEQGFSGVLSTAETELAEVVRAFVDVTCDVIADHGPGAWFLLTGVGFDPETNAEVDRIVARLSRPWQRRVIRITQIDEKTADAVASVLVASSRAVLRLWVQRRLERAEVVEVLHRCVRAVLEEFRHDPP